MYSLLGYSLFHNSLRFSLNGEYSAKRRSSKFNFDTFFQSLLSTFLIIIGDHWEDLFYQCYKSSYNNKLYVLAYFLTLVIFGQIILMNIFLSYLIDNFEKSCWELERNVYIRKAYFSYYFAPYRTYISENNEQKRIQKMENKSDVKSTKAYNILVSLHDDHSIDDDAFLKFEKKLEKMQDCLVNYMEYEKLLDKRFNALKEENTKNLNEYSLLTKQQAELNDKIGQKLEEREQAKSQLTEYETNRALKSNYELERNQEEIQRLLNDIKETEEKQKASFLAAKAVLLAYLLKTFIFIESTASLYSFNSVK